MTEPRRKPGRPKGSVSKANADLRAAARKYTKSALKTLSEIMVNGQLESSRVMAATALLDRGHGKPAQALTGEGGEGAVEIIVRWDDGSSGTPTG